MVNHCDHVPFFKQKNKLLRKNYYYKENIFKRERKVTYKMRFDEQKNLFFCVGTLPNKRMNLPQKGDKHSNLLQCLAYNYIYTFYITTPVAWDLHI